MITIDRIEGSYAIIDVNGETVEVPLSLLPPNVAEGMALKLVLNNEDSSTLRRENEERLARLKAEDPGEMEIDL
tara:strand:- start:241 stop:462 length:222 start_codon:yes stop_codon:yes gene_type:complete